ncbi:MAG TPA: phosphatase PAP2 family protein [Opitutaceae bacterium]
MVSLVLAAAVSAASYIAPDAIDVAKLLPPPPADGSPAGLADLETVRQLQADRTPEQAACATRVADQTVFTFAAPVLGAWFAEEHLPRTAALFKVITDEGYAVTLQTKHLWTRDRPYIRDPGVQPVPRRSRSPSYPSGHSADAATWAVILAEAFPGHDEGFQRQVREAMWGRVLGGSHYPSDTQAGRILGEAIGREMLKSPAMQQAIEEIRREAAPFLQRKAA